jgi:hypothetical protein
MARLGLAESHALRDLDPAQRSLIGEAVRG